MKPTDPAPSEEPVRVRIHTSLIERPLFGGVDLEFFLLTGGLMWTSFLVFKLTLPFWIVLAICVGLYTALRQANARDPFFLPVLIRSLLYRKAYAPRDSATEVGTVRPSVPRKAIPTS